MRVSNGPQCGADAAAPSGFDHQLDAPASAPHRRRMDQVEAEPIRAAGVICRAPDGSILMLKRVDDGSWAFPGGCIEGDETPEEAAYREMVEEADRRLGDVGGMLMRRIMDDGAGLVDFVTFLASVACTSTPPCMACAPQPAHGWPTKARSSRSRKRRWLTPWATRWLPLISEARCWNSDGQFSRGGPISSAQPTTW